MFAVIETGGKQYLVKEKDKLKVEKLHQDAGAVLMFDKVLLVEDETGALVGKPYLAGSSVEAIIVKEGRGKKISMLRYRSKTRRRRRKGHRQHFTEIEIKTIKK